MYLRITQYIRHQLINSLQISGFSLEFMGFLQCNHLLLFKLFQDKVLIFPTPEKTKSNDKERVCNNG